MNTLSSDAISNFIALLVAISITGMKVLFSSLFSKESVISNQDGASTGSMRNCVSRRSSISADFWSITFLARELERV